MIVKAQFGFFDVSQKKLSQLTTSLASKVIFRGKVFLRMFVKQPQNQLKQS